MSDFFSALFNTKFMPHGHCYFWTPEVLWLSVISDAVIALAYYSIPVALYVFAKKRKDLAFNWIFILFAIFILACGTTHVLEVWNVWNAQYGLLGVIKLITALASIVTAVLLWPLLPKALALPSPAQLRQRVDEATSELRAALEERKKLLESERNAREAAEQANRMKDDFLATLSHELRTPLNAMLGWVQLINKGTLSDARLREGLHVVERNARLQAQIIDDLLDMNRIVSGKTILELSSVSMVDIVLEAFESVRPMADLKSVQLTTDIASHCIVRGDRARITQVVWNLLNNAVKFTPAGGTVKIALTHIGSTISLTIKDSGKGIRKDFLPYVFDKFRQEDSSTSRAHGGLGLGLSIVKHLVELHGGRVWAESDGEGHGALFGVELPELQKNQETASVSKDQTPQSKVNFPVAGLSGRRIVVVDDLTDALAVTQMSLEHYGASVFAATNAKSGVELVASERPDVVISDIGMPGQDGYEFIRMLRELSHDNGGNTPAIALTAFAHQDERARILSSGYQAHISKPVDPERLAEAVAKLSTSL